MSSTRSKIDAPKPGRKASTLSGVPSPEGGGDEPTQGAISASLLQTMMESLKADICGKIDGLSASLRAEIAAVRQEFSGSIRPLQQKVEAHDETLLELERASTDHSMQLTELQAAVTKLTTQSKRLEEKCEDLEARSRRNNLRITGIPEGSEGPNVTEFVSVLLQDLLNLEEKPLLDRAHRVLREKPRDGEAPRPFIIRVHFFHVRNGILQRAGKISPLTYRGKRVFISPDYTSSVAKKRAAFSGVKRQLRSFTDVKFGLRYPATLKITLPDGHSYSFQDPEEATDFVNKMNKKSPSSV